ncbi:MAG: hypothetical protein Kow0040_14830 [Thermogutta sp.]
MIQITRSIVEVAEAVSRFPASWQDQAQVAGYLESLAPGLSKAIAEVAQMVASGRIGVIGASPDEIRAAIAEEIEGRTVGLDPALIEAIVTLVMMIVKMLTQKRG